MKNSSISYKRHRFPQQIIAHAVWLYFRFPLSLRLVEELLLERGIIVSYETIRRWGRKFGPAYAKQLRRRRPSRQDVWHLDEGVVSIAGAKHWLWRAVDQDGYVLDEIVQSRRDTRAARRLLLRLLKKRACHPSGSSPTNSAPIVRPNVTSCQRSNTGPERRILICHCENGSTRCRVSDQPQVCNVS